MHGSPVTITLSGVTETNGFYVTGLVEAPSAEQAVQQVDAMIRDFLLQRGADLSQCRTEAEDVVELVSFGTSPEGLSGFVFYPEQQRPTFWQKAWRWVRGR